jgi:hypothetical protein
MSGHQVSSSGMHIVLFVVYLGGGTRYPYHHPGKLFETLNVGSADYLYMIELPTALFLLHAKDYSIDISSI